MFKELIAMWSRQGLMTKVVEEFAKMLDDDGFVFSNAWAALEGKTPIDQVSEPIHKRDKNVNKREREIRRMLVEHLTVNPGQDVSGCLIMMSLVKDAERIGDYSKNIFDLGVMLKGKAPQMKYTPRLSSVQTKLSGQLAQLKQAFPAGNEETAKQILGDYAPIKTDCSKVLEDIFADSLDTREAVASALISRYLKRINSHISNIASGLVYPIDQIDFVRGGISD